MNEKLKIPDDLKALYGLAKISGENIPHAPFRVCEYIERIAKLNDALESARTALNIAMQERPCPLYKDAFDTVCEALVGK